MKLWPRMPLPLAEQSVVTDVRALECDVHALETNDWMTKVLTTARTGGVPVTQEELSQLRNELTALARQFGYPTPQKSSVGTKFDGQSARILKALDMPTGEGLRPETWAWLCAVLLPHVVIWRWPPRNGTLTAERFAGHLVRNQFGRIWYAQASLVGAENSADDWAAFDSLGSDQMVGLFERPALGANPAIARAVAEVWRQRSRQRGDRILFREAMKSLVIRAALQRLDLLEPKELVELAGEAFANARASSTDDNDEDESELL